MTKIIAIVSIALALTACAITQAPLDDAYYWPDKQSNAPQTTQTTEPTQTTETTEPALEYISVQDTAVTIRVKK